MRVCVCALKIKIGETLQLLWEHQLFPPVSTSYQVRYYVITPQDLSEQNDRDGNKPAGNVFNGMECSLTSISN